MTTYLPRNPSVRAQRKQRWVEWTQGEGNLESLIEHIADGGHLTGWCREMDFPYTVVRDWLDGDEKRSQLYARAREHRADVLAEQIERESFATIPTTNLGNVDGAAVQRQRLRVDSLKWVASKLAPKRYGEKLDIDQRITHDVTKELREFLQNRGGSRIQVAEASK